MALDILLWGVLGMGIIPPVAETMGGFKLNGLKGYCCLDPPNEEPP